MDAPTSISGTTYDLFLTSDLFSLSWGFKNRGITLSDCGLAWTIDGVTLDRKYSAIGSIRLHRAPGGDNNTVGNCQIRFRDGAELNVHGSADHGFASDEFGERYACFVRDLHARLAGRKECRDIRFYAGLTEGRHTFLAVAVAAAGLMLVLVPIGLLFVKPDLHVLGIAAGGIGLFWPFYRLWAKNRARPYSPAHVPEELLS